MKYGVIGSGAIGAYYGAKLAKAGERVYFLFHQDYDYVKEHGLQVDSCNGNFHLNEVRAYNDTKKMPQMDVVFVCLKTINNHLLKELLPPLLTENTLVVLIQNGVGVEEDVQKMFPNTYLAAGLAFICSAKIRPGYVDHQDYGKLNIGNYSCKDPEIITNLITTLNHAGITAEEVSYNEARWKKAVWNMPFNGLTVVMNTQTDSLLKNSDTRRLVRDMMMEVVNAAKANGVENIGEDYVETMLSMTDSMKPYSPSMKLDFFFHHLMEIPYIYSRPNELAEQAGCPMPKLKMLEQQLRFIEKSYLP